MANATAIRVADLTQRRATVFDLRPTQADLATLADDLGIEALRKLRFAGTVSAMGARDWLLQGRLGATVVQPCVVTLAPVTTRIETEVRRLYLADWHEPEGDEVEMPEDDETEPLGAWIDPGAVMAEALALALPQYPRAEGAELDQAVFAAPGQTPLRDDDLRPFAGLAGLRDSLNKDE